MQMNILNGFCQNEDKKTLFKNGKTTRINQEPIKGA